MGSLSRRAFMTAAVAATASWPLSACTSSPGGSERTTSGIGAPQSASPGPGPDPSEELARLSEVVPTEWGMDIPGVVSTVDTVPGVRTLALTFDACGGPEGSAVDTDLLDALREYEVPATLFLNSRWIEANPRASRDLVEDPLMRIENHGTRHCPLSVDGRSAYGIAGTASVDEVNTEISQNRDLLRDSLGVNSTWFRSGTAHYDDVAIAVAEFLGVSVAGFAVNLDGGATLPPDSVAKELLNAPDGSICIGHFNQPDGGTAQGVRDGLRALDLSTVRFVHPP